MKKVLNVGGNNKSIALPEYYAGWEHILLDIDPIGQPDIVCDARELITLPALQYDSVHCAHNLEHYYAHDVKKVLTGFLHVLKDDGFALICVPDIGLLMKTVVEKQLDINDVLYTSTMGDVTVHDVIYGLDTQIEHSGCDFYAHKTGFTDKSLVAALQDAGFAAIITLLNPEALEIWTIAFKNEVTEYALNLFGLSQG